MTTTAMLMFLGDANARRVRHGAHWSPQTWRAVFTTSSSFFH